MSGIGAAVVATAAGSVIGFLLLLSVIIVLLILFIKYVNQFTQTLYPFIIVYYQVEEVWQCLAPH